MLDYVATTDRETLRLLAAAGSIGPAAPVPSCPDWTVADLVWHLAEVQAFWGTLVAERLESPESYQEPTRPADSELAAALDAARRGLVRALASTPPEAPCWTWHDADQTAGFVRRRQAHEALIHRVDAELAAGDRTPLDAALACDGVDEIITVFMTGVPEWASFDPERRVRIVTTDEPGSWTLTVGRFTGTSPHSGNTYDMDSVDLAEDAEGPVDATITGRAEDVDLWLWGRGPLEALAVEGDPALAHRIRAVAADVGQ